MSTSMRRDRGARAALLALVCALGCRTPLPDLDATPEGAVSLGVARTRLDSLECPKNDCADWFRIEVSGPGTLQVEIAPFEDVAQSASTPLRAVLADASGGTLAETSTLDPGTQDGPSALRFDQTVERATYLIAVFSQDAARRDYRVVTRFEPPPPPPRVRVRTPPPPPPPPPPRVETVRTAVLEVEGSSRRVRTVLLAAGSAQKIRPGLRGRLLQGGEPIARIVVVEVFDEGCRARLEDEVLGRIGPDTIAELTVPPAPAPASRARP